METNYAHIINRFNHLSEKVICSKDGLKSLGTKKDKK